MLSGYRHRRASYEPPLRPPGVQARSTQAFSGSQEQQALLLRRLSYDIRRIIWRLVLEPETADDVLHLDLHKGSVQVKRCLAGGRPYKLRAEDVCCATHLQKYQQSRHNRFGGFYGPPPLQLSFQHTCWRFAWTRADRRKRLYLSGRRRSLALLLSCKQIYSESATLLYTSNIFDLRRAECILRLPLVIPARILENIRHIRFSSAYPSHFPNDDPSFPNHGKTLRTYAWQGTDDVTKWLAACNVLSSLKLKSLGITIELILSGDWDREARESMHGSLLRIMQPLMTINVPDFKVTIYPGVPQRTLVQLGPLPFQLIKGDPLATHLGINLDVDAGADANDHAAATV